MSLRQRILRFVAVEVLLKTVLLCVASTFLVYLLLSLTPHADSRQVPLRFTDGERPAVEGAARRAPDFPLDYLRWLGHAARGRFGRIAAGQNVGDEIATRGRTTFLLCFSALLPALALALLFGTVEGGPWLRGAAGLVYFLSSLPAFLAGYVLYGLFGGGFLAAAVTLGGSCGIINELGRVIHGSMAAEYRRVYMETAVVKGLPAGRLPFPGTRRFHAFRQALISFIPRINLLFPLVVSGSLVVEQVFRLPGLSYMLIDGLADKDIGRILIVILLAVFMVRVLTVLSGFLYLALNPRS